MSQKLCVGKFQDIIPLVITYCRCKYRAFVAENQAYYQAFSHQKKLKFSALNDTTRAVFEQVNVSKMSSP